MESRDVEFIENKFQTDFNSISERINNFKIEIKSTNNAGFNPNYRNKRTQIDHFIELRRSQRARKENNLHPNYISSQSIVFLVEGNKVDVLNKILILLIVEDDFKTNKEACLKMLLFQKKKKKQLMMKLTRYYITILGLLLICLQVPRQLNVNGFSKEI